MTTTGGAPRGNLNGLKNGSTRIYRLVVGELPKPLARLKSTVRAYRRDLEAACVEAHKEVGITQAHLIDAAVAAETHAGVCRWLLNQRLDTMEVGDIVKCSQALMLAKEARNRAVKSLMLDGEPGADEITFRADGLPPAVCSDPEAASASSDPSRASERAAEGTRIEIDGNGTLESTRDADE